MAEERWSRLEAVFAEALALPVERRVAFLDQACHDDRELRRRVESLLEHSDSSGTFVREAIRDAEPTAALPSPDAGVSPRASLVGQSLGRFRILEQLGAGGMGAVYLAEDTRLGRQVALKVLPTTLRRDPEPGMVTALQSANDDLTWSPHVHGIASRGGWDAQGRWIPVPYVDTTAAESLFRHKIFSLLKKKGLLSEERIQLLDSWR